MKKKDQVINAEYAKQLRIAMKAADIRGKELAFDLDVTTSVASTWMNNRRTPTYETAVRIDALLGCEISDIIYPRRPITKAKLVACPHCHQWHEIA